MRGPLALAAVVLSALLALGVWALASPGSDASRVGARLSLVETLGGGDTVGYARALEPRRFVFPDDHGAHPDFRTEWWYWTGNLETAEGRRFGFHLTFFRSALAPEAPATESPWATRQAWLAHFAVTDVGGGEFHAFERFGRGAVGLAGAEARPFRVWLDDWEVRSAGEELWPLELSVAEEGVGLELRLRPEKPLVLQGEAGLSRKGPEPGNASHYYSFTRLTVDGAVRVEGAEHAVSGTAWLDREWSTSVLSEDQVGWDWFALQLDDGRDLMVYRLRRPDGSPDPMSEGVLVDGEGRVRRLGAGEYSLDPTGSWTSPIDGATYPSGWTVRVPDEGLELTVRPLLHDQELDVSFRYWEGAVEVRGLDDGAEVSGRGYVELTGYAEGDAGTRGEVVQGTGGAG